MKTIDELAEQYIADIPGQSATLIGQDRKDAFKAGHALATVESNKAIKLLEIKVQTLEILAESAEEEGRKKERAAIEAEFDLVPKQTPPPPGRQYPPKVKENDWVGDYRDLDVRIQFGHLIGGADFDKNPFRVGGKSAGYGLFDDKGNRIYSTDSKNDIDRVTENRLRADKIGAIGIVDHMYHLNQVLNPDLSAKPTGYLTGMMKRIKETRQAHALWLPVITDWSPQNRMWSEEHCIRTTQGKLAGLDDNGLGATGFSAEWLDVADSRPRQVMEAYFDAVVEFQAPYIEEGITMMGTIPNRPKTAETGYDLDTANVKTGWRCDASAIALRGFRQWIRDTFTKSGLLSDEEGLKNLNAFLMQGGFFKDFPGNFSSFYMVPMTFNAGNPDARWLDFLTAMYQTLRIKKQQNQLFQVLFTAMDNHRISADRIVDFIDNSTFGQPWGPQSVATAAWNWPAISRHRHMIEQNPAPGDSSRINPAVLTPTRKLNRQQTDIVFLRQMVTSDKLVDFFVGGYGAGTSTMFVRTITSNPGEGDLVKGQIAEYWLDKALDKAAASISPLRVKPVYDDKIEYSLKALLKDNGHFSKVEAEWRKRGGHLDKNIAIVPVDDVTPLMGEYGLIEPVYVH